MNRLCILLFTTSIIGCVEEEEKLLENGLTKSASSITAYRIEVKNDSLGNETLDTVSVQARKFNENDQIISLVDTTFYLDLIFKKSLPTCVRA